MLPRISEEKDIGERLLGGGYGDGSSSEARLGHELIDAEDERCIKQRITGTMSQWTIAFLVLLNIITLSLLAIASRNTRTPTTPGASLLPNRKTTSLPNLAPFASKYCLIDQKFQPATKKSSSKQTSASKVPHRGNWIKRGRLRSRASWGSRTSTTPRSTIYLMGDWTRTACRRFMV